MTSTSNSRFTQRREMFASVALKRQDADVRSVHGLYSRV